MFGFYIAACVAAPAVIYSFCKRWKDLTKGIENTMRWRFLRNPLPPPLSTLSLSPV